MSSQVSRFRQAGGARIGRFLRSAVERMVLALIVLLTISTWLVERFEVPSGSMATTLLGRHRHLICSDCSHEFDCGADAPSMPGKRAVCPNCGYDRLELDAAPTVCGDRVLLDRTTFGFRSPRRWELAAFRNPAAASQFYVKRVAGLPKETIEIRHGDVYADGQIQRKTLTQQRALAVLVHDSGSAPRTAGLPPRWQGEPDATQWQSANGRFWRPPAKSAGPRSGVSREIDWLSYRHWRRQPGQLTQTEEAPITDQCGYNQTRAVIDAYPVRDLLVSCRVRVFGRGRLAWFVTDGQSQFLLELAPAERRAELRRNGTLVESADLPAMYDCETHFEWSLCDRRALLAINGSAVLVHDYEAAETPFQPTSRPVAVGSQDLGVELRDLRLYRDVYYTPPAAGPGSAPGDEVVQYRVGADEYLMLGDNSPVSADSRSWFQSPAIRRELLAGKPFLVYFPSVSWDWRGRGFQVPDLSRIRYIH